MPELPDITVYVERIAERVRGSRLAGVRLASPFVLRTVLPPLRAAFGKHVVGLSRLGKRVVVELEGELFIVIHLMVSGRFRWEVRGKPIPGKIGLAAFDFDGGTLVLTEASSKKRASIHLVSGRAALAELDRGGLELEGATEAQFVSAMTRTNHTLKRALTDPTILSGVGNAYSDEILHAAKLSPLKQTKQLSADEWTRLHAATNAVLARWTEELRAESAESFPSKVTAFREGMAVHGRYGKPCPVCGSKVQRIVYADNETNYCATCQTGGRLLADRSLSRLLRADWPRSLDELEENRPAAALPANPARSTRAKKSPRAR